MVLIVGFPGGSILPSNPNLPKRHCFPSSNASLGDVPGSICDGNVRFRRMSWNKASPPSLIYKDALLTNEAGTSYIPWKLMRITHSKGWMATVIVGQNYTFHFQDAPPIINISYRYDTTKGKRSLKTIDVKDYTQINAYQI